MKIIARRNFVVNSTKNVSIVDLKHQFQILNSLFVKCRLKSIKYRITVSSIDLWNAIKCSTAKLQWFNARELRSDKIHHHRQLLTSRLQHQRAVNVMNTDRLLLLQIDKLIERQSLQIWITTTFNDNNPLQLLPFASTGKHFFFLCADSHVWDSQVEINS